MASIRLVGWDPGDGSPPLNPLSWGPKKKGQKPRPNIVSYCVPVKSEARFWLGTHPSPHHTHFVNFLVVHFAFRMGGYFNHETVCALSFSLLLGFASFLACIKPDPPCLVVPSLPSKTGERKNVLEQQVSSGYPPPTGREAKPEIVD